MPVIFRVKALVSGVTMPPQEEQIQPHAVSSHLRASASTLHNTHLTSIGSIIVDQQQSGNNPFVVKVPEGATEVDLSPILRPLFFALRGHPLSNPADIEKFFLQEVENLKYRELLSKLNGDLIVGYLQANGWVSEDDRNRLFIREYDVGKYTWDRHGPRIHVYKESDYSGHRTDRHGGTVEELAHYERLSKLDVTRRIIAHTNILDRIAIELGENDV